MLGLHDKLIKITSTSILHDQHNMVFIFEYLKQSNDIRVSDFLENIDFLKDLLPGMLILELLRFDHLDRHIFAS